jgi:hypothetical protein
VAANVNKSSDFPRHHRSTSPDRAEVLMMHSAPITLHIKNYVSRLRRGDLRSPT